jgi:hypothetical protein
MFEEKKTKNSRRFALRFFFELPWIVRAFLNLLVLMLVGIFVFGLLSKAFNIPTFDKVSEELTSFLKLVVGAIIGSLSSEAKNYFQREDSKP